MDSKVYGLMVAGFAAAGVVGVAAFSMAITNDPKDNVTFHMECASAYKTAQVLAWVYDDYPAMSAAAHRLAYHVDEINRVDPGFSVDDVKPDGDLDNVLDKVKDCDGD